MITINIEAGLAGFFTQDHSDCDSRWAELEGLLDSGNSDAARQACSRHSMPGVEWVAAALPQ